MPYTAAQERTARAMTHGWRPPAGSGLESFNRTVKSGVGKGSSFADLVVKEGAKRKKKKALKHYGLDK